MAAQEASGFQIHRARISSELRLAGTDLRGQLELRLERNPGLLDAWLAWAPWNEAVEVRAGQMKIPSTYEVGTSSAELDFPTRSQFSSKVANWSLSKAANLTSPFLGLLTYNRDLGISLRAERYGCRAFFMVGNGLGANQYVGGQAWNQYIDGNAFGAFFYGIRLSVDPLPALGILPGGFPVRSVRLGGHASWNHHPELILGDGRTVLDLFRRSWSLDLHIDLLGCVRLTGMTGAGYIEDDANVDDKTDYQYRGWELKVVGVILPGRLEVGFRYDVYWDEKSESGDEKYRYHYTAGLTFLHGRRVRVQAAYTWKVLDSLTDPDIRDDVFILALQLRV
jgi:hypothetical protein